MALYWKKKASQKCSFTAILSEDIFFRYFFFRMLIAWSRESWSWWYTPMWCQEHNRTFTLGKLFTRTCDFGKQNDIIKCKCDVVMTTDLGNLQSVLESLAITKLSRITCRISLEKRKDKICSCGKKGKTTCIFSTRAVPQDWKPVSSLNCQTGKCQDFSYILLLGTPYLMEGWYHITLHT